MSVLDAGFVHLDRPDTPLHVGSLMVFEGPPPSYERLQHAIESRLYLVPRYRQKVRTVPLHVAAPVWVDDPHFAIEFHIRHSALPAPGDDDQLRRLVSRIVSLPLDWERPLWEMWLVEGLQGGRWALVNKTHHCMIDGASGADITSLLLAREPGAPVPDPPPWRPAPEPSSVQVAVAGVAHAVSHPIRRAAHVVDLLRSAPEATATRAAAGLRGLAPMLKAVAPEPFGLNGPIGPHRRWTWVRGSLEDVKAVRTVTGATINDVILAAITLGMREWLLGRGQDVSDRVVTTMVPVSTRPQGQSGVHDNQVSAMFADLPVGTEDPMAILAAVSEQLGYLKSAGGALSFTMMVKAADFVPSSLLALGARSSAGVPQRSVSLVTTNVPGPPWPLYLLDSRLLEMFPYIPLANDLRLTIGIFSYAGGVFMGVTGDYDAMPDVERLGGCIEQAVVQLRDAAARAQPAAAGGASTDGG